LVGFLAVVAERFYGFPKSLQVYSGQYDLLRFMCVHHYHHFPISFSDI